MYTVASIQARLNSTRLPGKVLFNMGDRRLLQWTLDRAEATKAIDQTVIAIGDEPENNAIIEYCSRNKIRYVIGSETNLLDRHMAVADQTDCDLLVFVTSDCPFIPSDEIDRVIKRHQNNRAAHTSNHTEKMPIGTAVDVIQPELLSSLQSAGEVHPVKPGRTDPDKWGTVWTDNPEWYKYQNVNMAVDTPSDYWTLVDAAEIAGKDPRAVAEWLS